MKNVLAVILGIIVGSIVNMGIILLSAFVIPPPAGVDVTSAESIRASMHLFEAKHFLFPFLAHAAGTLAGALVTGLVARSRKMLLALIVGVFYLIGGIANSFMIPAPVWFVFVDLVFAYIPMGYLGGTLALKK